MSFGCVSEPGPQGDQGEQGPQGAPGEKGDQGDPGTPGEKGDKGDQGEKGETGETGATGATGEKGDKGDKGDQGEQGEPGPSAAWTFHVKAEIPGALMGTVDAVTVGAQTVVDFTVTDAIGRGAVGLLAGSSGNVRMGLAKLIPESATGDQSHWQSYINRKATSGANSATQATVERTGTLVDHGDGTYTYTFVNNVTAAVDPVTSTAIAYEPTLTHRLVVQVSGGGLPPLNLSHDFIPNGGDVVVTRKIVETDSCNSCHADLTAHGSRIEVDYCVACHNPGTTDAESGASADFTTMVHRIHMGHNLPGDPYVLGGADFGEVTYPQDIRNCRKCHDGSNEDTPDGGNWLATPTKNSCGSCHADTTFATGTATHTGGAWADNSMCATCHTPEKVELYHLTAESTPHNPNVPAGYSNFAFEILNVTVDANRKPTVEFKVLRDGQPMDVKTLPSDVSSGPSFLLAYGKPQGNVSASIDYNNLGLAAGQPPSVSLANLRAGTAGTLTASTTNTGAFVAFINTAFPEGADMRLLGLQGSFNQNVNGTNVARRVVSVVKAVEGDEPRRSVVNNDKCSACHERLELHGGSRVQDVQICVMCHNPNLSTSGRGADPANLALAASTADDYGPDPLLFPESSNHFKFMIHGIHASAFRSTPYEFVRDRGTSGVYYYNWSEVTFPGNINNCETCHDADTYTLPLPVGALPTTIRTTSGQPNENRTQILAARQTVPNATDLIVSPEAASCYPCHDSWMAASHMEQNGAAIEWPRDQWETEQPVETCTVCHGPGRMADIEYVHNK